MLDGGEGNVCVDPKLADPANDDVHQTAASPTLDAASDALSAGIATDYEGDGRILDGDGRDGARLRGLPSGRFSVRIELELANGKTLGGTRRYRTCVPPRAHGVPRV